MDLQNIVQKCVLSSPMDNAWTPTTPKGSFYLTVRTALRKHLEEHGDWDLYTNCITKEVLRASQFEPLAQKFSVVFSKLGLQRGATIHLVVGNHNYTYPACSGAWILGAKVSCGGIDLDVKDLAGQLEDLDPAIVLALPSTGPIAVRAIEVSNKLSPIPVLSFGEAEGCVNVFDLLDEVDEFDAPEPYEAADVKKETTLILWSSGTTGLPKGVCHSHFTILNILGALQGMIKADTKMVATTCFFHVGGFFTGINAVLKHQTYHHMYGPGFSLELFMDTVKKVKPRSVTMGSHTFVQFSQSELLEDSNPEDFDEIKIFFPAGAPVPSSAVERVREKFTKLIAVPNIYGQTETGIFILGTTMTKLGTILAKVNIKFVNPETRDICDAHEIGEICVKNPYTMLGYLKRPNQTKEVLDSDGFARTGDLGYYDENGDIFFVDRMKELIKYQNSHIAPTELEDIMMNHYAVQDCMFFGRKDPTVQELVTAVIVLRRGATVSEEDLLKYFNRRVANYKQIRGGIIFRDSIPRNATGKLLRRHMRAWAERQSRTDESKKGQMEESEKDRIEDFEKRRS